MQSHPSRATFVGTYLALLVLLGATVGASFLRLGAWSPVVAMVIAAAKAVLILGIFMHLKYSNRLTWLFAAAGFIWLFMLVVLSLSDYLTRGSPFVDWPPRVEEIR